MNILRLPTLSLAVAIAVLALAYANPSFAGKPDKNCDPELGPIHASCSDPDKPGKAPKTKTELIVFTGADLQGWAHVEGCCPNAGPFPEYRMNLPNGLSVDDTLLYPPGIYDGELFMNGYGAGRDSQYIVQFHTCCSDYPCIDGTPVLNFEIIGGESVYDKKTKVLTVEFEDAPWWDSHDLDHNPLGSVSFTLTRANSCTGTAGICPCDILYTTDICPPSP